MTDPTLAGLAPDDTLEPRLRAILSELTAEQADVLEDLWREREHLVALAERHRLVLQSSSDAVLVTTVGGVVELWNTAATELFGRDTSLAGTRMAELVAAEEREAMRAHVQLALSGEPVRVATMTLRVDGELRVATARLNPICEHGMVTGLVVAISDVTDEVRARDEVAAANARYRDLVEIAADAIYTVDRRGVFTSVNAATLELLGLPRERLLGRSILPLLEADDQDEMAAQLVAVHGGARRRCECRVVGGATALRVPGRARRRRASAGLRVAEPRARRRAGRRDPRRRPRRHR